MTNGRKQGKQNMFKNIESYLPTRFRQIATFYAKVTLVLALLFYSLNANAADYKLGKTIQPVKQALSLRLDPEKAFFKGSTQIELRILEATKKIQLYNKGLEISQVQLIQKKTDTVINLKPAKT